MQKQNRHSDLINSVSKCRNCRLCETRKNTVAGEGNLNARLMFIGEGPGADENETGRPFIGRAGKLLTNLLTDAGINREDVYITNIVKCRPPDNRVPLTDEMEACKKYLLEQIEIIEPRIIGALGSTAAKFLLGDGIGNISKIRGQWFNYKNEIKIMPLFHPSYLLRNQSELPGTPRYFMREDIKKLGSSPI